MKKKITLTSVFAIFLSIAATILMSCLIFVHQSNQKLEKEIKNYLHIASQLYNGENEKEVMDYFHSFSIYIAIFSEDRVFNTRKPSIKRKHYSFKSRNDAIRRMFLSIFERFKCPICVCCL